MSYRVPVATYRLQLGSALTFDDLVALLPYLDALGVTDCYLSPFLETASQGSHGYDVADHNRLREELGGEPAFRRLAAALRARGMGLLADIVPNHMGIAHNRNRFWTDVLLNGPSSRYASFFDIDWAPVKRELADKVLLPILEDQYGIVLDAGLLQLEHSDGQFVVRYHDTVLPVAPRSYGRLLGWRLDELQARLGAGHPDLIELKSLLTWFVTIPPRTEKDPARLAVREEQREAGRRRLVALLERSHEVRAFVDDNVRLVNGKPGDAHSFDQLDALLSDQAYRLAYWRVAESEINYRRFFDINDLAAIHMEDRRVFDEAHRLILALVSEGIVTGLRIDHPDGLYAPAQYFRRLQAACGGDHWLDAGPSLYIVVEKILAGGERLPADWAVAGTTGYEFLTLVNGMFVDRTQARALEDLYTRLTGGRVSFSEVVYASKRLVLETSMASELNVLAHRLNIISEKHRSSRDFTLGSLTRALRKIIACFPVYRTYVGDEPDSPSERDREYIARAVALAKRRTPAMDVSVYDWIHDILTLRFPDWTEESDRAERLDWVMRLQQLTGPVMAKGYEDTALYRYGRLVSLNDVGGEPARFGTAPAEFHAELAERARRSPHGLSATSTHDTKRSEDVRARINVLSEVPRAWRTMVGRWHRLNRRHRAVVDGVPVPGPEEEYLIYQTLVGAWPISTERLRQYVLKAIHEAKVHTSWINQNPRYDQAMVTFVEAILDPRRGRRFLADFTPWQAKVARFGALNSLAQTLVKIVAPGVPDFYQGTELFDFSLVDPDNRRPVDWGVRRRLLDSLIAAAASEPDRAAFARALASSPEDPRTKLWLVREGLMFRGRQAALFRDGDYRPVEAAGPLAEHVCGFARTRRGAAAVAVVPRLLARRSLDDFAAATRWDAETTVTLPREAGAGFLDVLSGRPLKPDAEARLPVGALFACFPVALLERVD
jgi:(1->4)-alpha-D-glucan 1-alpha-D-glucosylmutase